MSDLRIDRALGRERITAPVGPLPTVAASRVALRPPLTKPPKMVWPWFVAAGCFVQYLVVGVWLIKAMGYTIGDANARTVSAEIMVLSRDPHLGAMGFYWQPLPMLIRVPFVLLLEPFGETILAGPASSALCAALVIPVLARVGRELQLSTPTSLVLIAVYALNPVTIFSAANAMSEAMFALVMALVLLGFVRFAKSTDVVRLAFLAAMVGIGVATRIEFVPVSVAVATACVLLVPKVMQVRTVAVLLVPSVFVFALWSLASSLIAGDALLWYHLGSTIGSSVSYRPWLPAELGLFSIITYVGWMILLLAPAFVVVVVVGATQPRSLRGFVGLLMISFTVSAFVVLQLVLDTTTGETRYFALVPLFACVSSMWVIGHADAGRLPILRSLPILFVVLGVIGAVATTYEYAKPNRTQILRDGVFFATLVGKPVPDYIDYASDLRPIMSVLEPGLGAGKRVAMDSHGGTALMFTSYPGQFIVPEDRDFEEIMSDPSGRFDYAIVIKVLTGSPNETIKQAIATVEGGSFELVVSASTAELWKFVPASAARSDGG